MTGPPGKPLRAGSSVIDVMGGLFGVIGVLAALRQRDDGGRGQYVESALFESTVFLVGQHMAQYAVTGQAANPMPVRISAWAIYEVFETADDEQVFVGVVSDSQWVKFCEAFGLEDLGRDPGLAANADRVRRRDDLIPRVKALFKQYSKQDLMAKLEHTGLPFAPISRPEEMFDDPHMAQSGAGGTDDSGGEKTRLPALPLEMNGRRFGVRHDLPEIGAQSEEILQSLGFDAAEIRDLARRGVVKLAG